MRLVLDCVDGPNIGDTLRATGTPSPSTGITQVRYHIQTEIEHRALLCYFLAGEGFRHNGQPRWVG
jgi:hypothetical protein